MSEPAEIEITPELAEEIRQAQADAIPTAATRSIEAHTPVRLSDFVRISEEDTGNDFIVCMNWQREFEDVSKHDYDVGIYILALNADGNLATAGDVISYEAPEHPYKFATAHFDAYGKPMPEHSVLMLDLDLVPETITSLKCYMVDFSAAPNLTALRLNIHKQTQKRLVIEGSGGVNKAAVILAYEITRKDDEKGGGWYLEIKGDTVAEAKAEGLGILQSQYPILKGLLVKPIPKAGVAPTMAASVSGSVVSAKVMDSVLLRAKGHSITHTPINGELGDIEVRMRWSPEKLKNAKPKGISGFLGMMGGKRERPDVDLDLGCLFRTQDGQTGVIQALGNSWGSFEYPPFIRLSADDRSGEYDEGEALQINGEHWEYLSHVLVFAMIYEGAAPNWAAADEVITVGLQNQRPIRIELDEADTKHDICAIAMLQNVDGKVKITKLTEFFATHWEMDRRFGFNIDWVSGEKT